MPKSHRIPCAGIIVIHGTQTILVNTKRGSLSFPKGKLEKHESVIEAAWRELFEETGLTSTHVTLIDGVSLDEVTGKGRPWIRYFVGSLKSSLPLPQLKFNPKELEQSRWYYIDELQHHPKFKDRRKQLLDKAYQSNLVNLVKSNLSIATPVILATSATSATSATPVNSASLANSAKITTTITSINSITPICQRIILTNLA